MIKTAARTTVTIAFVGAIVVYHQHLLGAVRQCGDLIASLGTGRAVAPPKLELPSVSEAIARGKGRGAQHVRAVLKDAQIGRLLHSPDGDGLVRFATGLVAPGAESPGAESPGAESPGAASPGAASPGAASPAAVAVPVPLPVRPADKLRVQK